MAQVSPEPEVQLGNDLAIDLGSMTPGWRDRERLAMAWLIRLCCLPRNRWRC